MIKSMQTKYNTLAENKNDKRHLGNEKAAVSILEAFHL